MLRAERVRAEFYDIRRRGIKTIREVGLHTAGGGIHPLPHSVGDKFSHGYLDGEREVGGFRGKGTLLGLFSKHISTHTYTHTKRTHTPRIVLYVDKYSITATQTF